MPAKSHAGSGAMPTNHHNGLPVLQLAGNFTIFIRVPTKPFFIFRILIPSLFSKFLKIALMPPKANKDVFAPQSAFLLVTSRY